MQKEPIDIISKAVLVLVFFILGMAFANLSQKEDDLTPTMLQKKIYFPISTRYFFQEDKKTVQDKKKIILARVDKNNSNGFCIYRDSTATVRKINQLLFLEIKKTQFSMYQDLFISKRKIYYLFPLEKQIIYDFCLLEGVVIYD